MNDEMETIKPTRHLATQVGCCHWKPIFPVATEVPDEAGERPVTPGLAESAVPPSEKKPD
jgi:hypothetical protein